MKKILIIAAIILMAPITTMNGQTYTSLWKQVDEAVEKDLPQSEAKLLRQIAVKAEAEGAYGQLLKAELQEARTLTAVSPDSLKPAVERLQKREEQAKDDVLRAIYDVVLGYIYADNYQLDRDNHEKISADYYAKALTYPEKLAATEAPDYEPFVIKGRDSRIFDDDLLSIIAYETGRFKEATDYYIRTGNRRAALFTCLELLKQEQPREMVIYKKAAYLERIDSMIAIYGDLVEAGELAIERYRYMDEYTTATNEVKWQYINQALDRWGSWQRMNYLRNRQRSLTSLQFHAAIGKEVNIPNRAQTVELDGLRGITSLTMRVYRAGVNGWTDIDPSSAEGYKKLKPLLTPLPELTQTHQYVGKKPYEQFNDSMQLAALPVGVYLIEYETTPSTNVSRAFYFVSDLRVLTQTLPEKQIRYVVVNATTGQPVKGAQLTLTLGYNYKKKTTITTDANGESIFTYGDDRPRRMTVATATDKACPEMNGGGYFSYYPADEEVDNINIFTDRSIYRPGQTVHAAAILYKTRNGLENEVTANKEVHMELRDANYQVVAEKDVTTDEYGACAADFTLPLKGLTGTFSIRVDHRESHRFKVEEYKRPTFEVTFPTVNQHYEDGDTVVVKATARSFAGVPVQGARVVYKVVRRQAYWWWSYSRYYDLGYVGTGSADEEVATGETVTDGNGAFTVEMPMVLPKTKYTMFYNFVVTAEVTDQAGETHQGTMSLPLGNRKTAFSTTMPDKVLAEKTPTVTFNLRNAAGIDIATTMRYRIDNGKWTEAQTNASLSTLNAQLSTLKSGPHTIEAVCEDDTLKREFVVFSLNDKRPATETNDWFYISETQFPRDGSPVTVQVGSSAKDVHIVYSIIAGKKVVESGRVDKSNELINRKLLYKEEYGNGLLINFAWVKDGKTYTHMANIRRPLPDMELKLQWQTFRNRLTPGQDEEWTLTVLAPTQDGNYKPANAQLMATLYDKSLDQLTQHSWNLTPYMSLPMPSTNWNYTSWGLLHGSGYKHQGILNVSNLAFSSFDRSLYPSFNYLYNHRIFTRAKMSKAMVEEKMAVEDVDEAAEEPMLFSKQANADEADNLEVEAQEAEGETAQATVRQNLNETAFFYPQLATDSLGQVVMKFTLPECLTTWRFMGVAHTKDMMHGLLTDEAVASKDVMIQPNMPRFVRMGDQATISARIFNTGEKTVIGSARLILMDAETEKVVAQCAQQVTLQPDSTVSVTFPCEPRDNWSTLLIAKVTVSGKDFSDGEQHYLPVLPNRERVTVTVPFTQNEPGTKVIDLTKLFPEEDTSHSSLHTTHSTLTVEYTNNPAWFLIQALPTIGTPHDDCALCQAASLYSNTIGRHILRQAPNAKNVFEMWKREDSQSSTLHSSLEKNQELKDLVLSETPWVMDAKREDEQKQRLADFFDENTMKLRLQSAVDKLEDLQLGDGSWSWWKGMEGSMYMTVEISEMLVRLQQMTGENEEAATMLDKSFRFMGNEIVELVKEMKKEEKKGIKQYFPSHKALQWLYICALDDRKLPAKVEEANTYLKNLLKKETKNQSIYEKAMSAIVLNSKTYIKSLKEYTVYKEEMGRYYDTQRAGYSWRDYRIPTQVAAIEAIKRMTPEDTQTITEMQRWLLQEKRTQAWDTPINSVDAVYAFMMPISPKEPIGPISPKEPTILKVDGKPIDTSEATAGIGYVKTTMSGDGVKTFTAEKTSEGTSWGAVYAQFMQNTSDINDQQSGISIKRELLIDHSPLTIDHSDENQCAAKNGQCSMFNVQCKVGDRIKVRITINADRDYDFVQVVDKRAACMEPVNQLSGYHWGYYCSPKDCTTNYYFDMLRKGEHVIETEYYIDRAGTYETGTCTVECAYSPEYRGLTKSVTLNCSEK